jgi:hypothetical protein
MSHIPPKPPTGHLVPSSLSLPHGNHGVMNLTVTNPNTPSDMQTYTQVNWNADTSNFPNWLNLSKSTGTLVAYGYSGDHQTVQVMVDASSLATGSYNPTIPLTLNYTNEPPTSATNVTVPVTVT